MLFNIWFFVSFLLEYINKLKIVPENKMHIIKKKKREDVDDNIQQQNIARRVIQLFCLHITAPAPMSFISHRCTVKAL